MISKGRVILMSMSNDIERWTEDYVQRCLAIATEITKFAKQFKFGHFFCGPGPQRVGYRSCSNKPNGAWKRIVRRMTQIFEETAHQVCFFFKAELFSKGDVKSKEGKQTIHFRSTTQTKETIVRTILA